MYWENCRARMSCRDHVIRWLQTVGQLWKDTQKDIERHTKLPEVSLVFRFATALSQVQDDSFVHRRKNSLVQTEESLERISFIYLDIYPARVSCSDLAIAYEYIELLSWTFLYKLDYNRLQSKGKIPSGTCKTTPDTSTESGRHLHYSTE